ncbi:hypothetical protein [Streptomyces aidingensis]|uniref:Uncharacterized protein n=1 Tax=Streptomyces aidingensis TaxID=910347 RepID=A0A1I1TWN3_9ACTN|nr:hypothetical protein [Streptomyces aidingensis]SFD62914.1 hypothetical protein SAMN05421773_12171 [Streptomyces aidingensis]
MRARKLAMSLLAVTALFVSAPTAAHALYSYNGADYSYDFNNRNDIETCDKESDSTGVKAVYEYGSNNDTDSVKDGDGNNDHCAREGAPGTNKINGHKTCETPNFWPDSCGNWQRY